MKKKEPKVQYGRSYRYRSTEQAIKDLLKLEKKQQAEKELRTISEAVEIARAEGAAKRGLCSMCAVGDKPRAGLHRGQYRCANATSCLACKGALPEGEQCQACGRINIEGM